jgi:ABC-type uncharacterized transport system permease subunit
MQFKSLGEGVAFVMWMNIRVPYESTSSFSRPCNLCKRLHVSFLLLETNLEFAKQKYFNSTLRFYIMLTLRCSFVLVTWFIMLQSFFGYRLSEDDVGE